jgi:hypothetical protein
MFGDVRQRLRDGVGDAGLDALGQALLEIHVVHGYG